MTLSFNTLCTDSSSLFPTLLTNNFLHYAVRTQQSRLGSKTTSLLMTAFLSIYATVLERQHTPILTSFHTHTHHNHPSTTHKLITHNPYPISPLKPQPAKSRLNRPILLPSLKSHPQQPPILHGHRSHLEPAIRRNRRNMPVRLL